MDEGLEFCVERTSLCALPRLDQGEFAANVKGVSSYQILCSELFFSFLRRIIMGDGLLISGIRSGSQADGKLQTGDEIVACNDQAVETWASLKALMGESGSDGTTITVIRSGERKDFTFAPGPLGVTFDTGGESGASSTAKGPAASAAGQLAANRRGNSLGGGGKYDTARFLVQVVSIVGWVVVAIGGLIFVSAITQDGIQAIVTVAAGAFVSLQGLVVVVVAYVMLATLDTAVNTGETVLLIRRLTSVLEKTESGETSGAEERQLR